MDLPTIIDAPIALHEAGRFKEALELLDRTIPTGRRTPERNVYELIRSELLLELGDLDQAIDLSEALGSKDSEIVLARAALVLAKAYFFKGDHDSTKRQLRRAKSLALQSGSVRLRTQVELTIFGIESTITPLEVSGSALAELKRLVAHSGNAHFMAELRLAVARIEARFDSPAVARRHVSVAQTLLEGYPSFWLSGVAELDMSIIASLQGDTKSSLDHAKTALLWSEKSGHFRTRVGALVNISHLLTRLGELQLARDHAELAIAESLGHPSLHVAALDSRADLMITTGDYQGASRTFEEMSAIAAPIGRARLHWDALTETYSRARLAIAMQDWGAGTRLLDEGIERATAWRDKGWTQRMQLLRLKCKGFLSGKTHKKVALAATDWLSSSLDLCIHRYAATAALSSDHQQLQRLSRALRVTENADNAPLRHDVAVGWSASQLHEANSTLPPPDLESAAALFDLAGHPHVLAREVFALVQGAGCARAAALVARGPADLRVLDTVGWDQREALHALRKIPADETIDCGVHRNETLQIAAQVHDDVDHRCQWLSLKRLVATALSLDAYRRDEKQRAALWPAESLDGDPDCVWISEQITEVLRIARRIGPTPLTVLLTGETGTGKEMMARVIHQASGRAANPLLAFNCTAVPREMLESQLFGYRKGAFTGAESAFSGIIRAAQGGTLFLDEIADMPLDVQPKLLRFLETLEIHPFGEPHPIKVDVRVIAATNVELEPLVAAGRFREDLFYRLNVVRLRLPPLRERREEIPALLEHHLRRCGDQQKKGRLTLSDEALEYLLLYAWPGNLRQLANEVSRMVAMAEPDATLTAAHLSPEILATRKTVPASSAPDSELRISLDQSLPDAVDRLERLMVQAALDRSQGRIEEAARLLGISRKGLFLKRRRWGLQGSE